MRTFLGEDFVTGFSRKAVKLSKVWSKIWLLLLRQRELCGHLHLGIGRRSRTTKTICVHPKNVFLGGVRTPSLCASLSSRCRRPSNGQAVQRIRIIGMKHDRGPPARPSLRLCVRVGRLIASRRNEPRISNGYLFAGGERRRREAWMMRPRGHACALSFERRYSHTN